MDRKLVTIGAGVAGVLLPYLVKQMKMPPGEPRYKKSGDRPSGPMILNRDRSMHVTGEVPGRYQKYNPNLSRVPMQRVDNYRPGPGVGIKMDTIQGGLKKYLNNVAQEEDWYE